MNRALLLRLLFCSASLMTSSQPGFCSAALIVSSQPGFYSTDLSDSTMLIFLMEKKEKKLTESEKTTVRITAYT